MVDLASLSKTRSDCYFQIFFEYNNCKPAFRIFSCSSKTISNYLCLALLWSLGDSDGKRQDVGSDEMAPEEDIDEQGEEEGEEQDIQSKEQRKKSGAKDEL